MKFTTALPLLFVAGLAVASRPPQPSQYPQHPPVESSKLRRVLTRTNLLEHAKALEHFAKSSGGTRAFGSKGHNATVEYIKYKLDATGYYDTYLQTFPHYYSEGTANFSAEGKSYASEWFTYGPAGNVTAPLIALSRLGCVANDFAGVENRIVVVRRGNCDFGLKVAYAGAAGAKGVVIINNVVEAIEGGTLINITRPEGPYVPAASISRDDGAALVAEIAVGEMIGTLSVDAVNEERYSSNVIAQTKGGDRKNVVMAGGHTDSVPAGPGINDDGSGIMGILEVALRLAKFSVTNAVRFGFWTAEEFGLIGSEHYVTTLSTEEVKKLGLYLNFDMIASPNFGYFVFDGDGNAFNVTGPPGSDHIEHLFENYFKSVGLKSAPTAFDGRSDYAPFLDAKVPIGGLFTGAEGLKAQEEEEWWGGKAGVAYDVCYHQACDGVPNLNLSAWIQNTKAAAHAIATYAQSLDGIPREKMEKRVALQKSTKSRRRHFVSSYDLHSS